MGFTQTELPPILKTALQQIEKQDGKVTSEQFRSIFYRLRFTSKDIYFYKIWLKENGLITVNKKYEVQLNKEDITNYIMLTCHKCGYEWRYKGKKERANCPACKHRKKKDIWVKTNITSSKN